MLQTTALTCLMAALACGGADAAEELGACHGLEKMKGQRLDLSASIAGAPTPLQMRLGANLDSLPLAVQALLLRGTPGQQGIADVDGAFLQSDAMSYGDDQLPLRRFVLAGISADCVLVEIEHGGRGHGWSVIWFASDNVGWHQVFIDRLIPAAFTTRVAE